MHHPTTTISHSMTEAPSTKLDVRVSPLTARDVQAAAECELLAFSGANNDPLVVAIHPTRPAMYAAGTPVRDWTDYPFAVRRIERTLSSALFFKGEIEVTPGDWRFAGYMWMTPPASSMPTLTWSEKIWRDYVYPAVNMLERRFRNHSNGTDWEFVDLFKANVKQSRRQIFSDQPFFSM